MKKIIDFVEKMKKIQKEAGAVLKRVQEEMKQQADRRKKKAKEQRVGNKVMLSMKDLVFKKRLAKKLVDQYIGLYTINEVISTNAVKS